MINRRLHDAMEELEKHALINLKSAVKHFPVFPEAFEQTLETCSKFTLTRTAIWFEEEMKYLLGICQNPEPRNRWPDPLVQPIVVAAACQLPGTIALYKPIWEKALENPEYADTAIGALGNSLQERAAYLGRWWRMQTPHRQDVLERMLTQIVREVQLGSDPIPGLNLLRHEGRDWPIDLKAEVNRILDSHGVEKAFREPFPQPASSL